VRSRDSGTMQLPGKDMRAKRRGSKLRGKQLQKKEKKENRNILFDTNPGAELAWKRKKVESNARSRQKKRIRLELHPLEREAEREKIAEKNACAKTKRLAEFKADPAAETAWILKTRASDKSSLEKKKEKKKVEALRPEAPVLLLLLVTE
jgi:hypothetical protein